MAFSDRKACILELEWYLLSARKPDKNFLMLCSCGLDFYLFDVPLAVLQVSSTPSAGDFSRRTRPMMRPHWLRHPNSYPSELTMKQIREQRHRSKQQQQWLMLQRAVHPSSVYRPTHPVLPLLH